MGREFFISQTVKREYGLRCPRCGKGAESGTAVNSHPLDGPLEYTCGQYVICGYCAALNIYDKPLLRTLDRAERRAFLRSLTPEQRERFELHMRLAQEFIKAKKREVN